MTTIDKVQELPDGEFHRLCDDLFRRLKPRYRRLRTHGLNPQGVSIKGQPDSYVGDTAATCTIAFQYSVDKGDWWNKIIGDVEDAVKASPGVQEIVVATPRNIDREGPKDKSVDWLAKARSAAGEATLQPYDGRDLASLLDSEHQDLRYAHLAIPYSRLSSQGILAGCSEANAKAVAELEGSGRYDPLRYVPRDADRRLFDLWQYALHSSHDGGSLQRQVVRLIAIVNDSGVGKTSLLATFVRYLGSALPAILIQAQDLAFASEDSLVLHVVQRLQGVIVPELRKHEEAAITHCLATRYPLTVVLDGLDEARDAVSVRRAITYWLSSTLGQKSVLVVSSRPEFWKVCVDRGWTKWMPQGNLDDRSPTATVSGSSVDRTDPADGVRLPDRFTEKELEEAWLRAGRLREKLFALPDETLAELRHPFTLRVHLDLSSQDDHPQKTSRAVMLEAWLNRRLDVEAVPSERLNCEQYRQALATIAVRLAESGGGSLSVDDLSGVPRFSSTHPPGPVVERLLAANILESVPGHNDRIRFAVEAVQDFYWAEAEVAAISESPVHAAERFAGLSFTAAYPRLARISQLLIDNEARHDFAGRLAEIDASKVAVILRANPSCYDESIRRKVVDLLGQQINGRHRVRGAFAIHLLSDLHCDESRTCLQKYLLPPAQPHPYLKTVGAMAFTKLGDAAGIPLVYAWRVFGLHPGNEAYFFKDTLGILRTAMSEFRMGLADYAFNRVRAASGTNEHGRAVCVLAYLGDNRLAAHLAERLSKNGSLLEYENHALIALGTEEAGAVFYQSAQQVANTLSQLSYEDGGKARFEVHMRLSYPSADHQYLYTPLFEPYISRLAHNDDQNIAEIGYDLAIRSGIPSLIRCAIYALNRWKWMIGSVSDSRREIPPDTWLAWWRESSDVGLRKTLLRFLPVIPNTEIEQILVDCLESSDFRGAAAWHLGHLGCCRSAFCLRQLLADGANDLTLWEKGQVAIALGLLRDRASVDTLRELALKHPKTDTELFAVAGLGSIGTPEAEAALQHMLGTEVDEQHIAGALIFCGTHSAVAKAIELAQTHSDGPRWFWTCMQMAFWTRGHRVGEYYTHIATADIVTHLTSIESQTTADDKWSLIHAIEQIDAEDIRAMLRKWASRVDTTNDTVVRDSDGLKMSWLCYDELKRRGDVCAIPYFLDQRTDERDDIYVAVAARELSYFPSDAVAAELRRHLARATDTHSTIRLLSLLGRFGDSSDEELIRLYLNHEDDLVANIACESLLRLTDPMLVPENWREM